MSSRDPEVRVLSAAVMKPALTELTEALELQDYNRFTWAAGVIAVSKEPRRGRALVEFLVSPVAAAVIRKRGMEPVAGQKWIVGLQLQPGGLP